jgi:hypothetical protein
MLALTLLCLVTLVAGQEKSSGRLSDVALFEQVTAPSKDCVPLSYVLSPPFDRSVVRQQVPRFLRSMALRDGGYGVIDEATRREAILQAEKEKIGGDEPGPAYHSLRARLRLLQSFAKVSVARRMADPESKSYSIQAMESGIDCMRDAARELETLEKTVTPKPDEVNSAELWEFHRRLLDIWDNAKKRDDLSLIRDTDLRGLAKEILKVKRGRGAVSRDR